MDHAADFHGDQLRLSVILRAAEKVPERPRRLQRNKQAPPSPATPQQRPSTVFVPTTTGFESSVKLAQDETSKASGDTMSELDARVQPSEHASDASEDDPSSGADSSSSTSGSAQYREPPIPDTERQQSEVTVVPSFTRRKKVVYTARKKQAKRSPTRVRSARKKCQPLSDNGLVLVRASTENGLPFPGVRTRSSLLATGGWLELTTVT
ncbi:hypothetical protein BU23DRAFT_54089 [Bimuria novae-zelandiae CBS 107.79]|uniref:Uncharacterized protein n=1 Tax=Bimuria novae-zelandiae CBS 107.79 TaxID=1447943 RepID=A0A6A5UIU3_9PLEO|nr:hypothetical protein BU23DRAFT_54089 [Bimuria novae-zelandiae CBS 107.79]